MLMLNPNHLHQAINRFCKFYRSTIIGFYLGEFPIVVVNDSENVKKVLYHRDFDGRPDNLLARMRHPNLDLHGQYTIVKVKFEILRMKKRVKVM